MTDGDARRAILARRARFVAAAIAGITVSASACSSGESDPQPCLKVGVDAGDAASDAEPQPCLFAPLDGG